VSQYTLVRHGAYAIGGDADFEDAVEACELGPQQEYRVRAAHGLLFPTLAAAQAAAQAANFPAGASRSRASAAGYFSNLRIGGAEIYVPRTTPGSEAAGS
jgi:hypothetical protein